MLTASTEKKLTLRMLKGDLPLLASNSSVDLVCLLAGRSNRGTDALRTLLEKIKEMMPFEEVERDMNRTPLVNTRDLVVLNRAMVDSGNGAQHQKVNEVIKEIEESVWKLLESIVKDPQRASPEDLQRMKRFCLKLSEEASVNYPSPFKRRHPARR